jgi:hypothetical protein
MVKIVCEKGIVNVFVVKLFFLIICKCLLILTIWRNMKKLKYIITTLSVFALVGINVSVLSNDSEEISVLNNAEAATSYCYYFDWDWIDAGTGFGCSASSGLCSIISNWGDCTHYSFSGDPSIIVTPDLE